MRPALCDPFRTFEPAGSHGHFPKFFGHWRDLPPPKTVAVFNVALALNARGARHADRGSDRARRPAATFQNCNMAHFPVVRSHPMCTRHGRKADSRHTRCRRPLAACPTPTRRPRRNGLAVAFARHRFSLETGRCQPAAGLRAPPRQATEAIWRFTTVSKLKHLVRRQVSRCAAMPAHYPKRSRRRPWHAPCVRSGGAGPTVPGA